MAIVEQGTIELMDEVVLDILENLRTGVQLDARALDRIVRKHSKRIRDSKRVIAKKRILPYYLEVKRNNPERFAAWNVDKQLDALFIQTMKMKPRRTASGVATITVITKPWTCKGNCIYCPCDVRMPKSYLHDEPACQRAERNYFDPYLQVASRLKALEHMGHATDKVELIVLGGSWTDYPADYRVWFVKELFKALNDSSETREDIYLERTEQYSACGISSDAFEISISCAQIQRHVSEKSMSFNEAIESLYINDSCWHAVESFQQAKLEELFVEHKTNETANHRVVGFVVETRPDELDHAALKELRTLGCTKVQMGVQSLDKEVLRANGRNCNLSNVADALALCRLFGFKTHVHFMLNLYTSTPEADKIDYLRLVENPEYMPDEVKLYPCALVDGTELVKRYEEGLWRPYTEDELVDVLCTDMKATPSFMRVSRMIRDISAKDILVGNRKTNLRQIVDEHLLKSQVEISEIRFREIGVTEIDLESISLDIVSYETSVSNEKFLQWVTPDYKIVGFLRLSLPKQEAFDLYQNKLPVKPCEAMIREVHIYGFAAKLSGENTSAQHHGLGRQLIQHACEIANDYGYASINVISAIGTREYYRKLGFNDNGLYQSKQL